MIELPMFALGLGLVILAWKFLYKPSVLGFAKDELRYLFNDITESFKDHPLGTSHSAYQEIRFIFESQSNSLEKMSLFKFFRILRWIKRHPELRETITQIEKERFASCDAHIYKIVSRFRDRAMFIVLSYVLATSLIGIFLIFLATAFLMVGRMKSMIEGFQVPVVRQWQMGPLVATVIIGITGLVGSQHISQSRSVIEEWGMYQS
ncbi:hypothetical protein [Craterilacuibacter sinensis]|uniref:Uncharacterized protein n=1 Tax=Craterilacuibacter sinensis TaxID=2686017 RepID=A0A845BR61_9NEIS|nr:hypothetical protein [Craterilacuibacter sinensis]MXR36716.1 hypothetical protein [Craterilacuibacter sinensis]